MGLSGGESRGDKVGKPYQIGARGLQQFRLYYILIHA